MFNKISRKEERQKRHIRYRKKVLGTAVSPRLSVYKSLKQIYLQLIDDTKGNTILSLSTLSKEYTENCKEKGANKKSAANLAKIFAEKIAKLKLEKIRFDRNGNQYHGVIKTLADTMRESGINL